MNEKISTLHRIVEETEPNICEITVIQDGKVCYEDYWNGFRSGDALNVMSVTKSIIALLTGIAIDKGYIGSVEQKVLDFFPETFDVDVYGAGVPNVFITPDMV